ncbi:hypothetical protein B0H14DRAFT_2587071 [Mycena olivaceomarginata]|nr:hypothetical protein B0H14DRAFT_2587071 [Mycena olivaceomarginata]
MSTSTESPSQTPNVADINGVHPSAVSANTQPDATKTQPENAQESTTKEAAEQDHLDSQYPEQKHAGAVGYGPNYNQGAGFVEKITGLKEQVKGKVTHNPELAAKGHERMTGELKHKELEEEDAKADPFANPEKKAKPEGADAAPAADTTQTQTPPGDKTTLGGARTKADV